MKDKQIAPSGAEPRIPVVSAALHCIAMTVLVFLRSSFGFAYLSPKSVFFAFSWAFALFTIFAWQEPEVWQQFRAVCLFGTGAVTLYWVHLLTAFIREIYRKGEHDHYSGRSHPLRVTPGSGRAPGSNFEMNLHLWVEPVAVLLSALALRLVCGERYLSLWLFIASACLWFKEAFNYWHHLRQRKRQGDIFEDSGEAVEPPSAGNGNAEPPKPTRKPPVKRGRVADPDKAQRESRAAELLRLLPPYSLEAAERNYHALLKMTPTDSETGGVARTAELNEAIEFFRENLGS